MTDPTAKPQPVSPTTATAPPAQGEIEKLTAQGLAYWEARLVVEARQLRARQNRAMLVLRFEGPAMRLWEAVPHVGQKISHSDMLLLSMTEMTLAVWAVVTPRRISME